MTRLAWGLIFTIALVAPDLTAKPAKRSKAPKESTGGIPFTLARPENMGVMNQIPARIVLEPRDGILSSHLTHLGQEPKKPPKERGIVLVGGDTVELSVRPGTYSVQVLTPVDNQPPGGYPVGSKPRQWESPVVKVVLARGEAITLVVEPGITDADYNGSWVIAKAAPPEPQADGASGAPEREQ